MCEVMAAESKAVGITFNDYGGMRQVLSVVEGRGYRKIYVDDRSPMNRFHYMERTGLTYVNRDRLVASAEEGMLDIITGTSNEAVDTEYSLWEELHRRKIEYRVVIDNWCNYKNRFQRRGRYLWPVEVITTDDFAYEKAMIEIGRFCRVSQCEWSDAKRLAMSVKGFKKGVTLVVAPPVESVSDEEWEKLRKDVYKKKVCIRTHPRDCHPNTLKRLFEEKGVEGEISNRELVDDLESCDEVIGFDSYTLYIARLCGKRVKVLREDTESGRALVSLFASLDSLSQK